MTDRNKIGQEVLNLQPKDRGEQMAAIHEADWLVQSPFTLIRKWPIAKDTFQVETEMPCSYWSDSKHIIADGRCRCGKLFEIVEVEKRPS